MCEDILHSGDFSTICVMNKDRGFLMTTVDFCTVPYSTIVYSLFHDSNFERMETYTADKTHPRIPLPGKIKSWIWGKHEMWYDLNFYLYTFHQHYHNEYFCWLTQTYFAVSPRRSFVIFSCILFLCRQLITISYFWTCVSPTGIVVC